MVKAQMRGQNSIHSLCSSFRPMCFAGPRKRIPENQIK